MRWGIEQSLRRVIPQHGCEATPQGHPAQGAGSTWWLVQAAAAPCPSPGPRLSSVSDKDGVQAAGLKALGELVCKTRSRGVWAEHRQHRLPSLCNYFRMPTLFFF